MVSLKKRYSRLSVSADSWWFKTSATSPKEVGYFLSEWQSMSCWSLTATYCFRYSTSLTSKVIGRAGFNQIYSLRASSLLGQLRKDFSSWPNRELAHRVSNLLHGNQAGETKGLCGHFNIRLENSAVDSQLTLPFLLSWFSVSVHPQHMFGDFAIIVRIHLAKRATWCLSKSIKIEH